MISYNNKLILEPYKGDKKIEATVKSGFAGIKQKSNLIGLKALASGIINVGDGAHKVEEGQTVYFEEEQLFASQWSKKTFTCEGVKDKFIIAPGSHVVMIK